MDKLKGIKRLIGLDSTPYLTISLYLDVDGKKYPNREYLIVFRNMVKEKESLIESLDTPVRQQLMEDFRRLENYLDRDFVRGDNRCFIAFVCGERGLFETFSGRWTVKNRLNLGKTPYLVPLISLMEQTPDALITLVDRSQARFFIYQGGRLDELEKIDHEVPPQVRESGWQGYEERRIERHVDDHVQRHLKEVAQRLRQYDVLYKTDIVLIGGPEDIRKELLEWVPASIKNRLGPFLEHHPERVVVQELIREIQHALYDNEREMQARIVHEILEKQPRMARTGVEAVLDALNGWRVATLVYDPDLTVPGKVCKQCGYLATNMDQCPRCQIQLSEEPDLMPDIIDCAVQQAADLVPLTTDPELKERIGGMGVIFRY